MSVITRTEKSVALAGASTRWLQLVFGIILIAVILWRPRGFVTMIEVFRIKPTGRASL